MSVTLDQIEELKMRSDISYEEAKELLHKYNGNILECLIQLEREKKIKCYKEKNKGISKIKHIFNKGNNYKFIVTKKGSSVVALPVNYLILAIIFGFYLVLISLLLIFITGCKMSIKKPEGIFVDVDDAIIDVANKVRSSVKKSMYDNESIYETNKNNGKKEDYRSSREKTSSGLKTNSGVRLEKSDD